MIAKMPQNWVANHNSGHECAKIPQPYTYDQKKKLAWRVWYRYPNMANALYFATKAEALDCFARRDEFFPDAAHVKVEHFEKQGCWFYHDVPGFDSEASN